MSEPSDPPEPKVPALADDVVAELERLADASSARPEERDLHQRLSWLVDVLIARGHLTDGHKKLIGKIRDSRPRVRLALIKDKRAQPSPDIDCEARLPLCKGRCCAFTVSLSPEDLEEGKLRWDLEEPYVLRRNPSTGYCENLSATGGCGVYHERPATCRTYDCREDRRVWIDFEQRIPAPMSRPVVPLGDWD